MVASAPSQGGADVMEMVNREDARHLRHLGIDMEVNVNNLEDPYEVDEEWLSRKMIEDRQRFEQSSRELLDDGEGKMISSARIVDVCNGWSRVSGEQFVGGQTKRSTKRSDRGTSVGKAAPSSWAYARAPGTGTTADSTAPTSMDVENEVSTGSRAPSIGTTAASTAPTSLDVESEFSNVLRAPSTGTTAATAAPTSMDVESRVSTELRAPGTGTTAASTAPTSLDVDSQVSINGRLQQPRLNSGDVVTGSSKERHRKENKLRRQEAQKQQGVGNYWTDHVGEFNVPTPTTARGKYKGQMCPSGLALDHPAADKLLQYSQQGCPVESGTDWTVDMMTAAIERGPHVSALVDDAMEQLQAEVAEKVRVGQARVVRWDDIRASPPPQLKISPIAMIPHKSRKYRAILDLSFGLKITPTETIPSVNESSVKTAPAGAIDQLGHSLARIIHAFAQADENAKVFMAKWDIKDGFWRLDCEEGAEWNFAYVLPQKEGEPIKLVVPTSLQMGWIESPPYFCAASETGRDVAGQYAEAPVGSLNNHKFISHVLQGTDYESFVASDTESILRYMIEVYVDDYISLAIPRSKEDLRHVANAVLTAIHDVFPPDENQDNDPISYKKLLKLEGMWALTKDILGFTFDGTNKTLWLEEPKRDKLLSTLKSWLSQSRKRRAGVAFDEFRSVLSKLRHAFIAIPGGKGLLSPCNAILRKEPPMVFFHNNKLLYQAIRDCRSLLRESTLAPTKCRELVVGWPDYVGIKDASGHGVGGIIVGENKSCIPTVFRFEWPDDIKAEINSESNPNGKLTNSDLECAGMLMLWLIMEDVCNIENGDHVAVFSDNQPTVSWVRRLASKSSVVAGQLVRALALRMKLKGASPLTPLHIRGVHNAVTDIPSPMLDRVPDFLRPFYEDSFRAADEAYFAGRVAATTQSRQTHWRRWCIYLKALGMDPHLTGATFKERIRCLSGYAAVIRSGYFNRQRSQVRATTVSSALTAVGKTCALDSGVDPTKCDNSDKFLPRLQEMLDGWRKVDPPTTKELPVEADVPEFLVTRAMLPKATECEKATADLTMVAYYYLLRVGEYTNKGSGKQDANATQTQQFKVQDVAFFGTNSQGNLYRISNNARDFEIMNATNAVLKLDNQKNGWKGVCVNHEHNGDDIFCGVRALGRRVLHIRKHTRDTTTPLSAFFEGDKQEFITDQHIRDAVKLAATTLQYPTTRGTPISLINTHSLRIGGACSLALAGYSDTQIQKMGRWRGASFKEYVRENLSNYAEGMSRAMKKIKGFVNIDAGAFTDVTSLCVNSDYGNVIAARCA